MIIILSFVILTHYIFYKLTKQSINLCTSVMCGVWCCVVLALCELGVLCVCDRLGLDGVCVM